jgi:hypothetical protein
VLGKRCWRETSTPFAQTDAAAATETGWKPWHNIGLLVLIAAFALVCWFSDVVLSWFGLPPEAITALWIKLMALLAVAIVLIGHGITGRFEGFLIDARNKMSLTRLHLILWTIVVLPAFLAAAVFNYISEVEDPLNIVVPPQVWGLLGISVGSLVGSGIIKSDRPDDDPATVEPARKSSNPEAAIKNLQDTNEKQEDASLSDLFKGELEGSKNHLEVGKVQMFFFTLLVVFAYGRAIANSFDNVSETIGTLLELSAGMLALLAISHAGYLANKNVPIDRENIAGT